MKALRASIRYFVNNPKFESTILTLVVINAIALGLETSQSLSANFGSALHLLDRTLLAIFCIEIGMRFFVDGIRFFRDPWKVFDFVVVAIALIPLTDSFSVMRAFRLLRIFRLLSLSPTLNRPVRALLRALPQVGSTLLLLIIVFYIFSVIATQLFGLEFPTWFGTVGRSMFSLFQIMTLESWSMGIVRPVMEVYPWAWMVFIAFIIASSFTVLNLFIAIVTDSMQTLHQQERDEMEKFYVGERVRVVSEVRKEFATSRKQMADGTREQTEEFEELKHDLNTVLKVATSTPGVASGEREYSLRLSGKTDDQDHVRSQRVLGLMYAVGEGVPQNFVTAYAWLSVAAANGHREAAMNRDRVFQRMSKAQIYRGQELAQEIWKRTP